MPSSPKQDLLRRLPSITDLLALPAVANWLDQHPRKLVTDCLRQAVDDLRARIVADEAGRCGAANVTAEYLLEQAGAALAECTTPHLRAAINATGIVLHTGLGRAVWPAAVVDSMVAPLKGYCTLAVDRQTGQRSDRDGRVEYLLRELTGAEAATVVNNNAAATMLVLAALAAEKEVIVSRGQLIEIGGAFRLPDVMSLSRARLVEVGTTNRTHRADYEKAITENTAALLRVHPSNFRVVGFTAQVALEEMVEVAHGRGLMVIDDLGAGALVDLRTYGLPREPTVAESVAAGADVTLFSADKLIGAGQGGILVGRKDLIARIRKHPLARAMRIDKSCLMALERTLMLFREPEKLAQTHPLYRMLAVDLDSLRQRAENLVLLIRAENPAGLDAQVVESAAYLGSGSLPDEALASFAVRLTSAGVKAQELARRLRMDEACIFPRVEDEAVILDVRTLEDCDLPTVAQAAARAAHP